ncbi:ranBP2-type zinc finger protein At1g67325-like isoform X3 [Carica papaya]|uniref:ranBP2-type zinc finger protein At1g67325-like isoform X3 n=1 Tax=Carica papaya TaxID=3649 RepID=UPI000B8CF978|nr:ranBP2-type zinc finger protein At1g67325-like isoform X3 [Carica papaya]
MQMQAAKSDKNSKQKMPEGSWKCEKCNNINYPFRTKCNRQNCGADKPAESKKSPSPAPEENDQLKVLEDDGSRWISKRLLANCGTDLAS